MNRIFLYALPGAVSMGTLVGLMTLSPTSLQSLQVTPVQAQTQTSPLETMTIERLEAILTAEAADLQGGEGQWQLSLEGQPLIVIADAANNRMRIMSPVVSADSLSAQEIQAMLVANFHSALDARYAVTNGTVMSVFVHPLGSLQTTDLRSALRQVATLASNFGTSYSSGGLGFGAIGEGTPQNGSAAQGELQI